MIRATDHDSGHHVWSWVALHAEIPHNSSISRPFDIDTGDYPIVTRPVFAQINLILTVKSTTLKRQVYGVVYFSR